MMIFKMCRFIKKINADLCLPVCDLCSGLQMQVFKDNKWICVCFFLESLMEEGQIMRFDQYF